MKLDRICRPKLLAVALATMLPVGAAQAIDLYDSLKTLLRPTNQDEQLIRDSPRFVPHDNSQRSDAQRTYDNRGAQGPYRSDANTGSDTTVITDQPVIIVPSEPNAPYGSPSTVDPGR